MIHFIKEGASLHSGLNITLGKFWVSFLWVSYYSHMLSIKRLRIRLTPGSPKIFFSAGKSDIINMFLWDNDLRLISRPLYEDAIKGRYECH